MQSANVMERQYVSFQLGKELFGVEVSKAREILDNVTITGVPRTPDYMLGVINLRSHVVPVIDMRMKLGVPVAADTRDTCILVVEVEVEEELVVVGIKADAVSEVLSLKEDQIEPPPRLGSRLRTEFILGMGKVADAFMILLDIDRVFSSDDLALVQVLGDDDYDRADAAEQAVPA